jgi:hypothetical protein
MCGEEEKNTKNMKITMHHAIGKRHKPVINFKIPLHRKCHDKLEREPPIKLILPEDLGKLTKLNVQCANRLRKHVLDNTMPGDKKK